MFGHLAVAPDRELQSRNKVMAFPFSKLFFFAANAIAFVAVRSVNGVESVSAKSIRPERELLITAPTIVDSDAARFPGAWSFGHLIQELVGAEGASACIREWLGTWQTAQTVNGQIVPARLGIVKEVIEPWQKRDGYDPDAGKPWEPKVENAPFRLLAIVNRMDLCAAEQAQIAQLIEGAWRVAGKAPIFEQLLTRATVGTFPKQSSSTSSVSQTSGYGFNGSNFTGGSFGEGRLVFGAVDSSGAPMSSGWTLIFEYKLSGNPPKEVAAKDRPVVSSVQAWARAWHALGEFPLGDDRYLSALESVTRSFTDRAPVNCPRNVALGQLRSSEASFGRDREFRQFELQGGALVLAPLTQTPGSIFNKRNSREQRVLAEFLHEQDPLIRTGLANVPVSLEVKNETTLPMLAGHALIPSDTRNFHWECGSRVSRDARRIFSLNTCNGCHSGETACDGLHIHPRADGEAAQLSQFLRTDGQPHRVPDPARGPNTEFREMEDRAAIFAALLEPRERSKLDSLRDILRTRLRRTH